MIKKSLEASILFGIIDLTSQIRLRGDLIYKFAGITTQQYVILLYLAGDPNIPAITAENVEKGMMASELADAMKVSRPGITNILKTLVQKGLVTQTEDPEDRRRKRLKLTDTAKHLIQEIEPLRKEANEGFLAHFNEEEKTAFLEYIRRCSTYAKEQLENPDQLMEMHRRIFAFANQ